MAVDVKGGAKEALIDVPLPVHKLLAFARRHGPQFVVFLLFLAAVLLRLGLVSLTPAFPASVMAADPAYHVAVVDGIKESGQWKYNPFFATFGVERSINQQPPLVYIDAAIVSLGSNLPSWTVLFFFVALAGGLRTIIVYLLCERLFHHKDLALLAAGLTVLPLPSHVWLYEIYIGFWIQVVSLTFLLIFALCLVRYVESRERWALLGVSFAATGMMLSHPQELFLIAPAVAFMIWRVLTSPESWEQRLKNATLFGLVPGVCFLLLLPWFMYVWKSSSYALKFNPNPFPSDYLAGITTPSIQFFPWWYLALAGLGLLLMALQWKKYRAALIGLAYFTFFLFALPFALKSPYYLGRVKVILPILLAPLVAFPIAALVDGIHRFIPRFSRTVVCSILCVLLISLGWQNYSLLVSSSSSVITDGNAWASYVWLRENTPVNATVLFISGCGQASCLFSQRMAGRVEANKLQEGINHWQKNEEFWNLTYDWAADTLWDYPAQEINMYKFQRLNKSDYLVSSRSVLDFDFVYLRDLNDGHKSVNDYLTKKLEEKGFSQVYSKAGIRVMRHG